MLSKVYERVKDENKMINSKQFSKVGVKRDKCSRL